MRLLETITGFDTVERKVLAEQIVAYKSALQLQGKRKLLSWLGINFDVKIERDRKLREALEGSVRFDGSRLRDVLDAALDGQLQAQLQEPAGVTPRDEVLRHLGPNPPLVISPSSLPSTTTRMWSLRMPLPSSNKPANR